ncbi:MAG: response regulator [Gemmatimonadales bacterium]
MTGRQRLLVIEDDPEIRYLLGAILAEDGREILAAPNGREARAHLEKGNLDLVVLDLILPDVDGRSLLTDMRDRPETAAVQVIVVTARGGPEARQDCYDLGADAFVEKPFDPDELVADVAVRLERAAAARASILADPLTGLLNKAGLQTTRSEGEPYALALIEIDDLGERAEAAGWDKVERLVTDVARSLRTSVGNRVALGRIGGGDFVLLLDRADAETMSAVADEALQAVHGVASAELGIPAGQLTATIGVVAAEQGQPLDETIDAARRRIFQARGLSGNQVVADDSHAVHARRRVLVAEDDEISASILVHKLKKEGLEVTRFADGGKAYEAALAEPPDLMVLDVKMPGLDGFEVLDRLRKDARFSQTAVVMLTSMGQEADVVRGFKLGADDYVLKPFSPVELTARVRRLLQRGRSAKAI